MRCPVARPRRLGLQAGHRKRMPLHDVLLIPTEHSMTSTPLFDLVKTLTELPGPIGHEDAVQDWLEAAWGPYSDRIERTGVNNLVAHVGGNGPRLLLQAHSDEICLMVRSISEDGFIHIAMWNADRLGRPPRWLFPIGQPALILGTQGTGRRALRDRDGPRRQRRAGRPGCLCLERLVHRCRREVGGGCRRDGHPPRLPRDLELADAPPGELVPDLRQGDGRPGRPCRDDGRHRAALARSISPTT